MNPYYDTITKHMADEINNISALMTHMGEKGRNNELVLAEFLERHLPKRYSVTTGKIVDSFGNESTQTDLIIHDRERTPALVEAKAWSLVPIETTYAVISVKSTLRKADLKSALDQIVSVRRLENMHAARHDGERRFNSKGRPVLRPRAMVFAFESQWTVETASKRFRECLSAIDDEYRPNGLCILGKVMLKRKPYSLSTVAVTDRVLLDFFMFLLKALDRFADDFRDQTAVSLQRYFPAYREL